MTKNKFDIQDMTYLDKVSEFHEVFEHPILDTPQIPDAKRCGLRVNLITEELQELREAILANDIVAAADAFADLQYVLSGAIIEFGLKDKFDALFAEVHRSNMSKACQTIEEAKETMFVYGGEGVESHYEERHGLFFVYRTSDKKTLKSIKYLKADLKSIIEK